MVDAAGYKKPLPQPDFDSKKFWEGCKEHKILIQRCKDCGKVRFPPGPMCRKCQCMDYEWEEVKGRGVIHSWVVVHYSPKGHGFEEEVPFAVAYVELTDHINIRLCGNLVDCKNEDIFEKMPVEVVFDDVTPEVTLPKWRPIK